MIEKIDTKLTRYNDKIKTIKGLSNRKELILILDRLSKEQEVEQELIYIKDQNNREKKGFFIFSNKDFCDKLNDKEYKNLIGFNLLNYLIIKTYNNIKTKDQVSINRIVETILKNHKYPYLSKPKILKRILTLSYYHNWNLQKTDSEIDSDFYIKIPVNFDLKLKQRFNLEMLIKVYEDTDYLLFINSKYDLCFVFKNREIITIKDLTLFQEIIQKIFKIKDIKFQ